MEKEGGFVHLPLTLLFRPAFQYNIFVFSVLEWNYHAAEANARSLFKYKCYLSVFNDIHPPNSPLQASCSLKSRIWIWSINDDETWTQRTAIFASYLLRFCRTVCIFFLLSRLFIEHLNRDFKLKSSRSQPYGCKYSASQKKKTGVRRVFSSI